MDGAQDFPETFRKLSGNIPEAKRPPWAQGPPRAPWAHGGRFPYSFDFTVDLLKFPRLSFDFTVDFIVFIHTLDRNSFLLLV